MKTGKKMRINQDILVRYFLGQASEEERERIHQWIEADEANRKRFIRERIRFDATILADRPSSRRIKQTRMPAYVRWSLRIAAVVVSLLLLGYVYERQRVSRMVRTFQCVHVPAGNRTNLRLPDGTNVWLNANTTLRYPAVFSEREREIQLDGEAYFEVAKGEKPFIVRTDKYCVEVLGTTFDVEAYADKADFKATLYEGKVKLYQPAHAESVYLSPGQMAELVGDTLRVSTTADKSGSSWKDGIITIESQSFEEIMRELEKYYDVRIVIRNQQVKDLGYRGKFRIADGVEHALRVLRYDFPFQYTRDEETNTIYIH